MVFHHPSGQSLDVISPEFKMVFFLEGKTILSVPGFAEVKLHKGDAYSMSLPVTQTYRSLHPECDTRLHFLRLAFRWPLSASAEALRKLSARSEPQKRYETILRRKLAGFQYFPHSLFGEQYPISRRILLEMEHQEEASAWKISGLCQTLTAGLLSDSPSPKLRKIGNLRGRPRGAGIDHALQYLQENCHEALMLDSIVWQVQMSGEHLARI